MSDTRDEMGRLRDALEEAERQAERHRAAIEALRKEAHDHQRETLRHVRNTLGVVRSIVCRTIADGETAEDFQARLASRIASFARLQSHLFRNPTTGVDLYALVADELLPFGFRPGTDAHLNGHPINLKPKAARVLGGAFHELARMGIEGGGLGDADSRLSVHWDMVADGAGSSHLRIDWSEGGRRARPSLSDATEFDRDVEGAVAYDLAGTVLLEMTSDTLNCRFQLPAKWVVNSPSVRAG